MFARLCQGPLSQDGEALYGVSMSIIYNGFYRFDEQTMA